MQSQANPTETLSPWWKNAVILILVLGFSVLVFLTSRVYGDAPPIPDKIVNPSGTTVLTRDDILAGQQVFLKYALMENGSIWGHGAYLGPDFSAEYLHTLTADAGEAISQQRYNRGLGQLGAAEKNAVNAEVQQLVKQNRYDAQTKTLAFTEPETTSYLKQIDKWKTYFVRPAGNAGLPAKYIQDPKELEQLTAFFA